MTHLASTLPQARRRGGAPRWIALASLVTLAACGGGGGGGGASDGSDAAGPASADCSLEGQKAWLRNTMADRYYWAGQSPNPEPAAYASVGSYFQALLFTGSLSGPFDRWSYISDTASYEQFFAEGRTLDYGVAVNGLEQTLPLRVRYVEARSPAAAAGVVRGDTVVSVNGRPAADLVARADFSALVPSREGDTLTLDLLSEAGQPRTVTLRAATFDLTPVPVSTTFTVPATGAAPARTVGYLVLKDFITQAEAPLTDAVERLRAAGASELILDLRYNGGGRVSTSALLGSLIAGSAANRQVFAELRYSARQSALNTNYSFSATAPGFSRVVVLTGSRTCSASELVVNGLQPHMTVSTVGGTTCGKPFGFNPTPNCGLTYSAVNFESFNARGAGRYYTGITPQCRVADRFTGALGSPTEALTQAALGLLATGQCPATASSPTDAAANDARPDKQAARSLSPTSTLAPGWPARPEPGERPPGMWDDARPGR